jgi:hypothetical protein
MIDLDYLVTGTGRCGTVNLALVLTSVGIPCSHERFFNGSTFEEALALLRDHGGRNSDCSTRNATLQTDGIDVKACASYLMAPFLSAPFFADKTIIHVVRRPVKVVLSFLNDIRFFWYRESNRHHESFIYEHLPGLRELHDTVDRAVHYYIEWNRMIRKNCRGRKVLFHRIEDGPAPLLEKMGVPAEAIARSYQDHTCNTWPDKKTRYVAEDVAESRHADELAALAAEFGYAEL